MKPTGNSAHARCQKGGVPEEAEIYLQLIHFKKVWYYGQFQRGRREKISKKEKEKGKRTRKKEDGKEESKKSKAHLIHSGPNSRSPAPSGNYNDYSRGTHLRSPLSRKGYPRDLRFWGGPAKRVPSWPWGSFVTLGIVDVVKVLSSKGYPSDLRFPERTSEY